MPSIRGMQLETGNWKRRIFVGRKLSGSCRHPYINERRCAKVVWGVGSNSKSNTNEFSGNG